MLACQQLFQRLHLLRARQQLIQQRMLYACVLRARQQLIQQRMLACQQLVKQRLHLLRACFQQLLEQRMLVSGKLIQQRLLACQQLFQWLVLRE